MDRSTIYHAVVSPKGSLTMRNRRSRRLAAVVAATGALTLLGAAGATAALAQPAGPSRTAQVGHQPDSGVSPLCVVMPKTSGCKNGVIQP
jgi:hypothetical protein